MQTQSRIEAGLQSKRVIKMVNALHPSTVQAELIDFGISWWRWELFGSIEQGDDAGARAAGWVADAKIPVVWSCGVGNI